MKYKSKKKVTTRTPGDIEGKVTVVPLDEIGRRQRGATEACFLHVVGSDKADDCRDRQGGEQLQKKGSIKLILLGGLSLFMILYVGWVALWSYQGEGAKKGRIGYHLCAYCGMTLSEQKFLVSILVKDQHDHDKTLHFDDIGCFFKYTQKEKVKIMEGVVYDFDSLRPIPIEKAFFEESEYQTPMGSGWISREYPNEKTTSLKDIL